MVIWYTRQVMETEYQRLDRAATRAYEIRAAVFKALGHPTRLFIIDRLVAGERCVCELAELINADMSTISKHLSVLRNAGIVTAEKRGARVFYRLRISPDGALFGCMSSVADTLAAGVR